MIIRNKIVYIYDIEVFRNVFHCTVINTETKELYKFEISERRNQLKDLIQFFLDKEKLFCGYNNIHYDDPIINYIIDYQKVFDRKNYLDICNSIFNLSKIITSEKDSIDKWKKWKYSHFFNSFDLLTMLYSKQLRVSLKELQVTMHYKNVQEFVVNWEDDLHVSKIDEMIDYNINDVESTFELLNRCKKDIDLRISIEDEYNIKCLSKDGVNIGMEILKIKYLEKTGLTWNDIKDLRSPMDYIPLKDVILPFISFKHKILQSVLKDMKKEIVSPGRKGYENKFVFDGLRYSIGVGGIHSINTPETVIPKDDELLVDIDVQSLYPSMLLEYNFYPEHLGKEFKEIYAKIKEERIEAKHNGNTNKNETLKLSLNGLSGNLQNEFSWCYSPLAVMKIRINGQLLLLMLAENIVNIGCKIIQANTDGLFVLLKKSKYNEFKEVCSSWEKLTRLTLEEERFKGMYQCAVNDYFAVKENGKVKEKGMFITSTKLGKGLTPKIIPKAVIAYLKDNIPVEETIKGCTDIKDFIMSEKTGKQWTVEYNNLPQQRINRFYASNNGAYLWKYKLENGIKKYQNMLASSGVTLLNKFDNKNIKERNINYHYYIYEAYKVVRQLKPLQLSLWD